MRYTNRELSLGTSLQYNIVLVLKSHVAKSWLFNLFSFILIGVGMQMGFFCDIQFQTHNSKVGQARAFETILIWTLFLCFNPDIYSAYSLRLLCKMGSREIMHIILLIKECSKLFILLHNLIIRKGCSKRWIMIIYSTAKYGFWN